MRSAAFVRAKGGIGLGETDTLRDICQICWPRGVRRCLNINQSLVVKMTNEALLLPVVGVSGGSD